MSFELLEQLAKQTSIMSSIHQMRETAAYQEVVKQGEAIVPTLLSALEHRHAATVPIMVALAEITRQNPVPPKDRGIVAKMATAWLRWGEQFSS